MGGASDTGFLLYGFSSLMGGDLSEMESPDKSSLPQAVSGRCLDHSESNMTNSPLMLFLTAVFATYLKKVTKSAGSP